MSARPQSGSLAGTLLATKFSVVHVWDDELNDPIDELCSGTLLIVLAVGHTHKSRRLNPDCYLKVLTSNGHIGWIHIDNCTVIE